MATRQTAVPTYRQNMSKQEVYNVIKAIGTPLALFGLGLFTITNLSGMGTKLVCPLSGLMWFTGVLVAFLMPSMRQEVLNQTMITTAIYYLTLIGLKYVVQIVSGVSAEMFEASFDQALPSVTGNNISGYVQTMMWFTSVLVPIGSIGMQGKRLFQFKRNQSLQKSLNQKRNMRQNGQNGNSSSPF